MLKIKDIDKSSTRQRLLALGFKYVETDINSYYIYEKTIFYGECIDIEIETKRGYIRLGFGYNLDPEEIPNIIYDLIINGLVIKADDEEEL